MIGREQTHKAHKKKPANAGLFYGARIVLNPRRVGSRNCVRANRKPALEQKRTKGTKGERTSQLIAWQRRDIRGAVQESQEILAFRVAGALAQVLHSIALKHWYRGRPSSLQDEFTFAALPDTGVSG